MHLVFIAFFFTSDEIRFVNQKGPLRTSLAGNLQHLQVKYSIQLFSTSSQIQVPDFKNQAWKMSEMTS